MERLNDVLGWTRENPKKAVAAGAVIALAAQRLYASTRPKKTTVVLAAERAYVNTNLPKRPQPGDEVALWKEIKPVVEKKLAALLEDLEEHYPAEAETSDATMYLGALGVAYMYWRMHKRGKSAEALPLARSYLQRATELYERHALAPDFPRFGMLGIPTGIAGAYMLNLILDHEHPKEGPDWMRKFRDEQAHAVEPGRQNNEWLQGAAGYLNGQNILRRYAPDAVVPADVSQVVQALINAATKDASGALSWPWPFMAERGQREAGRYMLTNCNGFKWGGTWKAWLIRPVLWLLRTLLPAGNYLGMAHGNAGVLYHILAATGKSGADADPALRATLAATVDALLARECHGAPGFWPCGAFPSDTDGFLLHYCHGSPGMTMLFALAYDVLGDARYRDACTRAADATWRYGLLRKGAGLCHGIAGNAYSFFSAYRATKDPTYLYYAQRFAQFISETPDLRRADAPYSLFEGTAGTICFLHDMLAAEGGTNGLPVFPVVEDGTKV